ncbi:uncharacterized protein MAM_07731 [Metarhizium album ARSEF 1941]|uniref:Rhodopsin domain-containing protein n=1 Tax=Metarhizium album (strain ARSEF 1941) TaxID=1081103 RepID=A0A0B2WN26_METAS|nr:uncharacterized protein MAM_07731 [Metarhizium album ARSEF 1941]KHN94415.1 hypothetical protein MAM_07731 [Metarhizium album ARSEF 1941]
MAATPFRVEAWIEYAIGIVILLGRIAHRVHVVGRNWHGDDFFAVAAVLLLTGETAMLELIGQWGSIVGLTDDLALSLTGAQKQRIVMGAKADIAGWCLYITLIWCLKACMLFFYRRLTLETRQKRLVTVAAVACVCSYVATVGVVLLRCLPFRRNWQVYPIPGAGPDNCASPNQIFLTLVVTNVFTDLLLLFIPLPLLWIVRLPWSKYDYDGAGLLAGEDTTQGAGLMTTRKLVYGLWLTTGIFVIVASLLRCVLSLQNASKVDVSTIWAIRETFVGIISVNAPILGPWIIRKGTVIVHSVSSRDRSGSDLGPKALSVVTIGRAHRPHCHGGKYGPTDWTAMSASEEYMVGDEVRRHGGTAAPWSWSVAAPEQVWKRDHVRV